MPRTTSRRISSLRLVVLLGAVLSPSVAIAASGWENPDPRFVIDPDARKATPVILVEC